MPEIRYQRSTTHDASPIRTPAAIPSRMRLDVSFLRPTSFQIRSADPAKLGGTMTTLQACSHFDPGVAAPQPAAWTTSMAGLSPAGWQPCWLLSPAHDSPRAFTGWQTQAWVSLFR
jgi:hypothetical protein